MSDRFASALWAVDYLLDAARRGVVGVNLNGFLEACFGYTPLCADAGGQLHAWPVFYALLFVHAVGVGAFLPVSSATDPNLGVYAVRRGDGSLAVVAVNRDAHRVKSIAVDVASTHAAQLRRLTAPGLAASGSVTFGGASVRADGTFAPSSVAVPRSFGYRVNVLPGSAVILTIPT